MEAEPPQIDIVLAQPRGGFWPRIVVLCGSALLAVVALLVLKDLGFKPGLWPLAVLLLALALALAAGLTLPLGKGNQPHVTLRREGIVVHGGLRAFNPFTKQDGAHTALMLAWSDIDRVTRIQTRAGPDYLLRLAEPRAWDIIGQLITRSLPLRLWQSDLPEPQLHTALEHFFALHGRSMTPQRPGPFARHLWAVTAIWTITPRPPQA